LLNRLIVISLKINISNSSTIQRFNNSTQKKDMPITKEYRRQRIKMRLRKKIKGTEVAPRLTVFRSNKDIYAQVINDVEGKTLAAASSRDKDFSAKGTKIEVAKEVGKALAAKALAAGISKVVYDRNGYLYHGRVKALAEAAREGGLNF
jgi:large subunit ribosomal protein L18